MISIRALRYITGDTQQAGFRCIGSSDAFPADQLPWLNNGETIQERARVISRSRRQGNAGMEILSHVWEYQTGRYGCPVVIQTKAVIGTGRQHAFSEYVMGCTENAAELADAGQLIRGADRFEWLNEEDFLRLGRNRLELAEEQWIPETDSAGTPPELNEAWKLALLSNYWKQASIRAFSQNSPETVRVCLGEFDEDRLADTEQTIEKAKAFFAQVVVPNLPRQIQNIASIAAGVNCADENSLYTALEFDITQNMFTEETLRLNRPADLRRYRLNGAETAFIRQVTGGEMPSAVRDFWERYRSLSGKTEATELNTPFMADYRVWYGVYCMDRLGREKQAFLEEAGLTEEPGNPRPVRCARACFTVLRQLRQILETDHRLNENQKTDLVTQLLELLETPLLRTMLEDMQGEKAEPFLLRRNEMVDFHRRLLYHASEEQAELMIGLEVLDQQASRAPQFVRCFPAVHLRSAEADARNGRALKALLPAVIRPLITEELPKGKIENPYLIKLQEDEFAKNWACLPQNRETRAAAEAFFREEIQDADRHFLLYRITMQYLRSTELFRTTLRHFLENHTRPGTRPSDRQMNIAAYGARETISGAAGADPQCLSDLNRYYSACFWEYRENIGQMGDILERLGGDTTETLTLIFSDETQRSRLRPEEASAAFGAFADSAGGLNTFVRLAYTQMLSRRREESMKSRDPEGFSWHCAMVERAPWQDSQQWITDRNTEGVILLCDLSSQKDARPDQTALATVQTWIERSQVGEDGMQCLLEACNNWMERGYAEPMKLFLPYFGSIDEKYTALRDRIFADAVESLKQALQKPGGSFSGMIDEARRNVERSGRKLDDLYEAAKEPVEDYLDRVFSEHADPDSLIAEREKLPANTRFLAEWQKRLKELIEQRQIDLFREQPNPEALGKLRRSFEKNGVALQRELKSAYELLDGNTGQKSYEQMLEDLIRQSEWEALAGTGGRLSGIHRCLQDTGEVRKKLCAVLRNISAPAQKQLREQSFRHALCAAILQASLTDQEGTVPGCPDWNQVLNSLFTHAELENAARKPYAKANLPVLQRMLTMVENVRLMTHYKMDQAYLDALVKTLHKNADWRAYQTSLARNRKMCELYRLQFTADGLDFLAGTDTE